MRFSMFMEQESKGTYAGVRLSDDDSDYIISLCNDLELPNPITKDKIHLTLLYSRKHCPAYVPAGRYPSYFYFFYSLIYVVITL